MTSWGFTSPALHGRAPRTELTLTKNAQPALLVHSVAVLRVMEKELVPWLACRPGIPSGSSRPMSRRQPCRSRTP